jgi:chromate transporter
LVSASWPRERRRRVRWVAYLIAGGAAAAMIGPWLVLVLLGGGLVELLLRSAPRFALSSFSFWPLAAVTGAATGGLAALSWVAFKVGALSYGGGFVIVPLMQSDAVNHYHWMTDGQFLNAVALGQITPGPVVQTVAVVGYAAAGIGGGLIAAAIAFAPSFAFVLVGAPRFERLRENRGARAFLSGAGPAAIGAILGSAVPLARALAEPWQFGVLAATAILLVGFRRSVVLTLLAAGAVGVLVSVSGGPLPR